jgi:thiosulfate dehydrogenase (quinone) large subunit
MTQTLPALSTGAGLGSRAAERALVALRIGFGLNWLSNALAKLFGVGAFHWGGFTTFNLVDRGTAHAILGQAAMSTVITPLRLFYGQVVLTHWGFFQWFLTVTELAIAIGLLFGIATRLAALGGLLLLAPIWIMLLTTNQYLWTYPLDLFPLVLLAIAPSGRLAGADGALAARFHQRWPF